MMDGMILDRHWIPMMERVRQVRALLLTRIWAKVGRLWVRLLGWIILATLQSIMPIIKNMEIKLYKLIILYLSTMCILLNNLKEQVWIYRKNLNLLKNNILNIKEKWCRNNMLLLWLEVVYNLVIITDIQILLIILPSMRISYRMSRLDKLQQLLQMKMHKLIHHPLAMVGILKWWAPVWTLEDALCLHYDISNRFKKSGSMNFSSRPWWRTYRRGINRMHNKELWAILLIRAKRP